MSDISNLASQVPDISFPGLSAPPDTTDTTDYTAPTPDPITEHPAGPLTATGIDPSTGTAGPMLDANSLGAYNDRAANSLDQVMYPIPGMAAAAIDTVGRSVGLLNPTTTQNFINNNLPASFADYYGRNKEALQLGGDLATFLIPGTMAAKAIQSGSWLYKGLEGAEAATGLDLTGTIGKLFASGSDAAELTQGLYSYDLTQATKGAIDFAQDPQRMAVVSNIMKTSLADAAKKYIASETAIYLTMNQSENFYPSDMSLTSQILLHGIGLGVSGAIEGAFVKSQVRRSLTRPEVSDALANALYPDGAYFTTGLPGERDYAATVSSVAAADQRVAQNAAAVAGDTEANSFAVKYERIQNDQLKQNILNIYSDGLPGVVSKAATDNNVQTIMSAAKTNPTVTMGIRALDDMPDNADDFADMLTTRDTQVIKFSNQIDKLMADPVANADQIDALSTQRDQYAALSPVVVDPTGDVRQVSDVKSVFQNLSNPPPIVRTSPTLNEAGLYSTKAVDPDTGLAMNLGVDDDLTPLIPNNANWTDLSRFQQSTMYALGQKVIDNYKPGMRIVGDTIPLTDDTHPFTLGMVNEILSDPKIGSRAIPDFQFPAAAKGAEQQWVQNTWLKNSYDQVFLPMFKQFQDQGTDAFLGNPMNKMTMGDIGYALNFPASQFQYEHPALQVFRSLAIQGDTDLSQALGSMDHFNGLMKEEMYPAGGPAINPPISSDQFAFLQKGKISPFGQNFSYPTASDGSFLQSQLAWVKPLKWDLTATSMRQQEMATTMDQLAKFQNAPELPAKIFARINGTQAFSTAQQVDTLANGMQSSTGWLTAQNMATREVPVFTAVDMVSNAAQGEQAVFQKSLLEQHADAFRTLQSDQGASFNFNQFVQARRYGFELSPDAETDPTSGMTRFLLKTNGDLDAGDIVSHTGKNTAAWQRAFGSDIEMPDALDGAVYLPDITASNKAGQYVPLAINDGAFQGAKAFRDISDTLLDQANFFRAYNNRPPINRQEWHLPPQNLSNRYVKYVVTPAMEGNGAATTIISGNSPGELARKMAKPAIQDLLKPGATTADGEPFLGFVMDQKDVAHYFDLHDDAFFNLANYSDALAQTGGARGTTATPLLEYGNQVFNDMLSGVESQLTSATRRTVASIFRDQINYAQMAHMGGNTAATLGRGEKDESISIWKMYVSRLLGVPSVPNTQNVLNGEVPLLNKMLVNLQEKIKPYMPSSVTARSMLGASTEQDDFSKLRDALGGTLPFSDAADFAANTFKVKTPITFEKAAGALNGLTSNLVLRILETGNAVSAIAGNLVSMPLVMNSLRRTQYDTDASWAARTGFMGANVGNDMVLPNPIRMMSKGVSYLFSPAGQEMITQAKQMGNIQEMMAQGFRTLHSPFENTTRQGINKVIDALSMVSDKGEQWSRMWAYSAGYQLAQHNGVENIYDAHNIANMFADNVIANYRQSNRPLAFQGAIGGVMGLFQSYMWNYYGRMFRYIENKDYRSLAINYAMQGSIFGASSVPGYQQFNSLYAHAYDGQHDITDSMDRKFGLPMSDLIMHGTLSSIPRLFSKDGVSIYSRGDANITRVPALISPENAPIYSLASNTYDLVGALFNQLRTGGIPSAQQTLETLGTYSLSRPIGRLFELAAGVSADRRGEVLNNDTRSTMGIVSRLMGMRTLMENRNIETLAKISNTEAYQEEISARTDNSIRSLFRGNPSSDAIQNGISKAISDHLANGGNPYTVGDFIQNAITSAYMTKQDSKLMDILNSPGRLNDILRLTNNMTAFREDDK